MILYLVMRIKRLFSRFIGFWRQVNLWRHRHYKKERVRMMQTLFICPGNVDHRIKLPLIDLTCNELPYNPAAKGDQNAASGAFNFPDKITQATLNLRQGDKRYQQQIPE
ncbi:Uncharacterised protein [Salmonella enterica subsp. enterica]|uniref:Uncharacterized protein n=1 Tax=Salmonella enterica I TaxID=59201 RepID=A0A447PUT9_SALET|nr:Uncharacterised protein [Salmonella enterica subsp. enterica]